MTSGDGHDGRGGRGDGRASSDVGDDDARAFAEATRGAKPLDPAARRRRAAAASTGRAPARPGRGAETAPGAPFSVEATGDAIAAIAPGIDRAVLRRLRAGEPPIEATLDLHKLTRAEALAALERFVGAARSRGARCVLVVHGRGNNSAADGPVLRPAVWDWLTSSRAARDAVMALASARPQHGGGGATVVLLRKSRRP